MNQKRMTGRKRIFLIDGPHAIYRSYHAIRSLSTSKGLPTNATYGFTQILQKIIKEYDPEYLAVVFDTSLPTFRHQAFAGYKANRPPMPDDLSAQMPWIRRLLEACRIPQVQQDGYEGDDVIGTLACQAVEGGLEAVLVSGDKDLAQLAGPNVKILNPGKDSLQGPEEIVSQFGVTPGQIPDFLALCGDTVDNLPGVPGVGPKTAAQLLQQFGSLEQVLQRSDEIENARIREAVKRSEEAVRRNLELVKVDCRVPLTSGVEDFKRAEPDHTLLRQLLQELEFQRLLDELPPERRLREDLYQKVLDELSLSQLIEELSRSGGFALHLETTPGSPMFAGPGCPPMFAIPLGMAFAAEGDRAWYIPVAHHYLGAPAQLPLGLVLERLRPLLEDQRVPKFGQDLKYELLLLKRLGVEVQGVAFDTMLASFLLDPSRRGYRLADMAPERLSHKMLSYDELTEKKGSHQKPPEAVGIEQARRYCCEDAHAAFLLTRILEKEIRQQGLDELFHQVEIPLLRVLMEMEFTGIRINTGFLADLAAEFGGRLGGLEQEIYRLAGESFNINSPQQLGVILFDKLKLPGAKRTKTGYGTNVRVLTRLAELHPLPRQILDYRSLSKLLSTYVEALPRLVNPETGRLHTCFNQCVAITGRLSSSDPNLQNIPIRTLEGRKIRQAFIPSEGMWLVSADYSQIELRVLAHVSGDERLLEAFRRDQDVHAHTASTLFGCSPEEMTPEMRSRAKTINFGVVYGMGAFGLAEQLSISREAAREFIEHYFQTYQGVKNWQQACLEEARKSGYVTTLLNRRRPLPEISSKNAGMRAMAERTAINTPIQGTAADLIKMTMIRLFHRLRDGGFRTRMILQVHDELLFDVPEAELEKVKPIIRDEMEGVLPLKIPLKVDLHEGRNWSEAH